MDKIEEIDLWDAENEPQVKFFCTVYTVEIPGKRRNEYKTGVLPFVYVEVADDGLIGLASYTSWNGKKVNDLTFEERREVYDWLTEWEFAEWKRIGPEDSELFATEKLIGKGHIDHRGGDPYGKDWQ